MKKEQMIELSQEQLIERCLALQRNYSIILARYRVLKADILLIKKQLENIANNIIYKGAKSDSRIYYYKGGKI